MAWQGGFYFCQVDRTDSTKGTANFLEYQIDYSKSTITPTNGSWTLINNWGYNLPFSNSGPFTRLQFLGTYSNGRRYAFDTDNSVSKIGIHELTATGTRDTGIRFGGGFYYDANFDSWLLHFTGTSAADWRISTVKFPFLGFDGSNNPSWGGSIVDFQSVVLDLMNYFPQPENDPNLTVQTEL